MYHNTGLFCHVKMKNYIRNLLAPRLQTIRSVVVVFAIILNSSTQADTSNIQNNRNYFDETKLQDWNITHCVRNLPLDLVFLIDSAAVNGNGSIDVKQFIVDIIQNFEVDSRHTRISLLTFDRRVRVDIDLSDYTNTADVIRVLRNFTAGAPGDVSLLRRALRHVKNVFFGNRKQSGSRRSNVPFILIVVTGERSLDPPASAALNIRRKAGRIITAGFGRADRPQLALVASHPLYDSLFEFQSSKHLQTSGPNTILSAICNEVKNRNGISNDLKKSLENAESYQRLEIHQVASTPNSITLFWRPLDTTPSFFNVSILPNDRTRRSIHTDNLSCSIFGLRPSSIYKISITPSYGTITGQPRVIVFNTAPLPPANITMEVVTADACAYQRSLQIKYNAEPAVHIPREHCRYGFRISMLLVQWSRESEHNVYNMSITPHILPLSHLSRKSSEQIFLNPTSGVNYTVHITSQAPRLMSSETSVSSIVANPQPPTQLAIEDINITSILLTWRSPANGVYDSFKIVLSSAFERRVIRIPVNITLRNSIFTQSIANILFNTLYLIKVYSTSFGVSSKLSANSTYFKRAPRTSPGNLDGNENLQQSILFSTSDGIYSALQHGPTHFNQSSLQRVVHASGGVVNAVHYHKYNRDISHRTTTSNYAILWIERQSSEIKITSFELGSNTVTLVKGLLQPVGLAVDFYGGNVYWTDIGSQSIGVASTDVSGIRDGTHRVDRRLISGADINTPISITLDPVGRHLFWSDLKGSIMKSGMDGTGRMLLLSDSVLRPHGITYSAMFHTLYWVDSHRNVLESMRTDGSGRRIMLRSPITQPVIPSFLSVVGNRFFWANSDSIVASGTIESMNGSRIQFPLGITNTPVLPGITGINTFDISTYERAAVLTSDELIFPCVSSACHDVCIPVTLQQTVCVGQCFPWEAACPNSTNICVNVDLYCDGKNDCPDGFDENLPQCDVTRHIENCSTGNSTNEMFQCQTSGKCIDNELLCNGRIDCRDSSDEANCPPQSQNCDFNGELCLWSQDSDDDFDWMLWHRRTPSNETGPYLDHTQLETNSSYLYAEATSQNLGDKARLNSVWLANPVCIKFHYHMRGAAVGNLSLYVREYHSGNVTKKWQKSGNQGLFWNVARVSLNYNSLYQIILEASRGEDYRGDIAVDDVSIQNGLCQVTTSCSFDTFDDLLCGYEQDNDDWILWSGPTAKNGTIPQSDENEDNLIEKPSTSPLDAMGPEWFYYDFMIEENADCNACNGTKIVRELISYVGPKLVGVILCNTTKYKIYLGYTLRSLFRNIADGAGTGEDHCEFVGSNRLAYELGDYRNCRGQLGFTRRRWNEPLQLGPFGNEQSLFYSPSYYRCNLYIPQALMDIDPKQTTEKLPNYYLLFNSSQFQAGHKASVRIAISAYGSGLGNQTQSKNQTTFTRWCLNFRYYMHGADVGRMVISVNSDIVIWSADGDQGSDWKLGRITIPAPEIKYDLTLTAEANEGHGNVALDDIFVEQLPCFLPNKYYCDFNYSIEECSFTSNAEVGQIMLTKLYELQPFDPIIVNEIPQSSKVLTYVENVTFIQHPVIMTPVLPALTSFYPAYCLNVQYRQRSDEGDIGVILRSTNLNQSTILHHVMLSPQSKVRPWLTFQTEVNTSTALALNDPFMLEFHGLKVAWVNKISVETQPCNKSICNNGIRCGNNICVLTQQLCDGVNNCGDWTDEIGCSSQCGTQADIFSQSAVLLDPFYHLSPGSQSCIWRVHGNNQNNVLIQFGVLSGHVNPLAMLEISVYDELPRNGYRNESLVLTLNGFSDSSYFINSTQITVVMAMYGFLQTPDIWINITLVDHDYCNFVCDNRFCLMDNYACDGIVGCPDSSDELYCTRINYHNDYKLFEVRRLNDDFSLLCGEDVTVEVADKVCQQLGYWRAETPLRFITIPSSAVNTNIYRLNQNLTFDSYSSYLQAYVFSPMYDFHQQRTESHAKSRGISVCPNRNVWIANCESYQCGVRASARNQPQSYNAGLRLVGGQVSRRAEWPWIVSLQDNGEHTCGGTIISERHILTAAHCFDNKEPTKFSVVTGANDIDPLDSEALVYEVKHAVVHPNYDKRAEIPDWDIAVLEVKGTLRFSQFASSACLPGNNIWFRPGKRCHLAGYGRQSEHGSDPYLLYDAETPLLTHQMCNSGLYHGSITARMICAGYPSTGGIGICHGDSGGPLLCEANDGKWYLTGIVSWSIGCAHRKKPDVFTNIQYFMPWINMNAKTNISIPIHAQPGICGAEYFNSSSGYFSTPGWPSTYLAGQNCIYRILAGPGQTIQVVISEFAMEQNFDFLIIYNGGIHNSALVDLLSGKHPGSKLYTVHNNSMELVFESDGGVGDQGFIATFTVTGTPVAITDNITSVEIVPSGTNRLLSNPLFYGIYHPSGKTIGHRPSYIQRILLDNTTAFYYYLYYNEAKGQWRINELGGRAEEGNFIYVNDSAAKPELIRAAWQEWSGNSWTSVDLRMERLPNMIDIVEATIPDARAVQLHNTTQCVVKQTAQFGFMTNMNLSINRNCDRILQPQQRSIDSNGSDSDMQYIILLVNYFSSENGHGLNIHGDNNDQSLYFLQGNTVQDEHPRTSRSEFQFSGSGEAISHTVSNESLNNSSFAEYADNISQNLACFNSLSRFSNDACNMDIYNIFRALRVDPTNTLLKCHTLLRCSSVSWCDLRNLLVSMNSTHTNTDSLLNTISHFCDNALWTPSATSENEISGSGELSGVTSREINSSSTSSTNVMLFVYQGQNLSFTVSGNASRLQYYITYHVVSALNQSLYDMRLYNVTYLNHFQSHRSKRSSGQIVPLSMFGHPTLPPWQAVSTTRKITTTPTTHHFNNVITAHTTPPSSTSQQTTSQSVAVFTNVVASCGGSAHRLDHNGARWVITSPNHPQNYPLLLQCEWQFTTNPGYQVVLYFTALSLEAHENCRFDWVKLYNTTNTTNNSPVIGKFCEMHNTDELLLRRVSSSNMMKIVFNSDYIVNGGGFRAVLSVQPIQLPNEANDRNTSLFACDFNTDRCSFEDDDVNTQFTWTRNKLGTASAETGPNYDDSHDGSGYYMYIETSTPRQGGDRARLITPVIHARPEQPVCLRFSYDMFGNSIGILNVYVKISLTRNATGKILESDNTMSVEHTEPLVHQFGNGVGIGNLNRSSSIQSESYLLWMKSGKQRQPSDKPWSKAAVNFYPFNSFQLVFEGVAGRTFQSDIAIDNILVIGEECSEICNLSTGHYQCTTNGPEAGECILQEMVCDGKIDCLSGSDESSCSSTVRLLCNAEPPLSVNSTKHRVCSSVDLCGLRSLAFTRIDSIICDGVYDCFSGIDETQCPHNPSQLARNQTQISELNLDCGHNNFAIEDNIPNYPNVSTLENWPWVAGLYVKNPSAKSTSSVVGGYTFICSVVFIRQSWALVPAHCMMTPSFYSMFSTPTVEPITTETPPELINLAEFDEHIEMEIVEEETESETRFNYAVIASLSSGENLEPGRNAWKVSKWIIHPMYGKGGTENQTDSSSYTTAPNAEQNIDMDVSRVNHDIALLKLEPDESVTSASTDNEYSDILDTSLVIEQYAAYDSSSENSNISVSSPFFPACLEKQSVSSLSGVSNNGVGGYVGAFKVPSETERFSPEYLATLGSPIESGLPSQARCQLVGHSPSFSHRVQENGTDNTLFWKLRNFQSFVTSSDFSLPYIFCISRSSASERERCARRFIQNTSGEESATNMELTQLIRSGFKGIRTGAFLNDQGLALFCQRHDGRWFLNGLYNWINLKRNFMRPNFREAIHRPQAWTNSDSKMGISLGTDYFTMLTPSLNHWIENTLIDACPGEFSCYPPDSMLHLCIAPDRVCDGIIDCAANFADEKGCPSGCSYDPYFDAYYTYYSGLQNSNVFIPADIYNFGGNYSSVHRGALRGWINDTSNDRNIIRFNQVDGVKVKSCNWVIKAPAGKVAVLVIPKINSNSDRNGGTTYIISGRRKIQHDRSSGPNYYTSIPGQSVTFMLSPINGQQYLSEIRTHHFEYYLEDIGECRNQHRCGDGRCVSPHKVCNGDFDCSDLSDEINCPSGCGDISLRIGASYGTFSSRNYPHSYKGSGDCLWIMLARSSVDGSSLGNQITLQFMDFVMSYKDILFVFNGVGRNKKIHDIFSGHQSPFNLTIPSSQVTLVLRNNDDIAERRMNGSYRITTSAVLN